MTSPFSPRTLCLNRIAVTPLPDVSDVLFTELHLRASKLTLPEQRPYSLKAAPRSTGATPLVANREIKHLADFVATETQEVVIPTIAADEQFVFRPLLKI